MGVSCRALKATKGCTFCMGEWFEQIRLKKAPSAWVKAIDEHQKAILARAIDEHQKAKEDEAIQKRGEHLDPVDERSSSEGNI